ncbi:hypothetical protein [Candidatus Hodgkinia cicadicola]|uniref:hypothetical protein n=1 Tax=Candidatus Hodgkinia cicadicola TaxID=573658 RepID=UPI0011BA4888
MSSFYQQSLSLTLGCQGSTWVLVHVVVDSKVVHTMVYHWLVVRMLEPDVVGGDKIELVSLLEAELLSILLSVIGMANKMSTDMDEVTWTLASSCCDGSIGWC